MISQESARQQIAQLVARYKALSPRQRKEYNESATRQGFILPLFRALGWNTDDTDEVRPEEQVSRGFVDYAFRIGGVAKFFLETKKIPEDLGDPRWARQAINYAWTKGVTWAVLCDFEELKVFNAEVRESDPRQAIFLQFTADTYLSDFERLWWLSRPECEKNALDREAEKWGKRTLKRPVGDQLLDNLMEWRRELYRHLSQYNPNIPSQRIDESVQRILDRLVFIRAMEDREVEPRRLIGLAREYRDAVTHRRKYDLVPKLVDLFREFDAAYDSRLFEKHLLEQLDCEPEPFVRVIEGLYNPDAFTEYDFNAIDADVLGAIYEQYLGHVAQVRGKDIVELEAKKAKRKAQGIYYTPQFVVRYIVRQTLGRLLDERGLQGALNVRVLDPACGSGSFLIEAFAVLDRFLAAARNQQPGSAAGDLHDHARRMEILSRNIYGVDLDAQAVEVAQLNLLLRAANQRGRLPMLKNIRQGNSLISDDVADAVGTQHAVPLQNLHPFNWYKEFPEIMAEGGFDVVIGNPPYVRQETLGAAFKEYARDRYQTYAGTADLYVYFIERAMSLLRPGGYMGFIVANKWMRAAYGEPLRRYLKQQRIVEIIDFGDLPVFQQATTYPCILILQKAAPADAFSAAQVTTLDFPSLEEYVRTHRYSVAQDSLSDEGWSLAGGPVQALLAKLRAAGVALGEYVGGKIYRGVLTGLNEAFVIDERTRNRLIADDPRSAELIKPFLLGRDVKRYEPPRSGRYLILIPNGWTREQSRGAKDAWGWLKKRYPAIAKHLAPFAGKAEARWDKGEYWWELRACDYYAEFENPKMILPDISTRGNFAFDEEGLFYSANTTYIVGSDDRYLLGLLNSVLLTFFYRTLSATYRGGYLRFIYQYLVQLPIRVLNLEDPAERAMHDRMVALVQEMLRLKREHAEAEAQLLDRRHDLAREIERTDREIDRLVYQLYGLTEEEIAIVEGAG